MRRISSTAIVLMLVSTARVDAQSSTFDLTASDGGFTQTNLLGATNVWQWQAGTGWFNEGSGVTSLQRLLSPVLTANSTAWGMSFVHANNFEGAWDGGQVKVSINGGAFMLLGMFADPYDCVSIGNTNPQLAQPVFCDFAASRTTSFTGSTSVGNTLQFAFEAGADQSVNRAGNDWEITSMTFDADDFTSVPEPSTWMLLASGLAVLGWLAPRRRSS
jgi:hypothetical protein